MPQFSWRGVMVAVAAAGIAFLAPRAVHAQTGKISGVVTDAGTGQPIEGVQVVIRGTGMGAVTQANGRYFIISVPPGNYAVQARRIGYQVTEVDNVEVRIDVTREVNFRLTSANTQLGVVRVEAPPTPLVEQGITGSSQAVTADVIQALPVTNVSGVLSLQQGFLQVPQNTDIVSFTESRRNPVSPIRIRGGRAGETLTLIDGFPINNVVFGGPAMDVTTSAVEQLDYVKSGMEPQYGNALSGIINVATREGGTSLAGNVEYQSSNMAGALGSRPDELRRYNFFRGYLSGPIPATANRLRFMLAGDLQNGRDAVYQFDQDVRDFDVSLAEGQRAPSELDLFPGWRGVGYDATNSVLGKLTFLPTARSKVNFLVVDYNRNRQPFDYDFILTGFNPLTAPAVNSISDTLGLLAWRNFQNVVLGSIKVDRRLYGLSMEQQFGRSSIQLRAGRFNQSRNTCNYFQGVCLGTLFADVNFEGRFVAPGVTTGVPYSGTDTFYGGEDVKTNMLRADLQSQVTDHHNLQGGIFYQQHDIAFNEWRNLGTNAVSVVPNKFAAKPYDAAVYVQDRIEYDFLTVKLGFRYDYGRAKGLAFVDPRDPTNGTTARQVCEGSAPSIGATSPFTGQDSAGRTVTGLAACTTALNKAVLLDSATRLAQRDDFAPAKARIAFSPRIGLGFPLSENASLFFNAGRYTQNPLYNNLYQNTGVGTIAGAAGGDVCASDATKPGTNECVPTLASDAYTPPYIGNPNLKLEQTTAYEIGYAAQISRNYAINVALYNKNQTGLTGIRRSKAINDIGTTYAGKSSPIYFVVVNQDYATSRGIEVQFRRRIANYWGYDINYSYSQAKTNAAPPDRQQQNLAQGDSVALREIPSEVDQPHSFNASLLFRVDERAPDVRFGSWLRNSYLTITQRVYSGLPYTPLRTTGAFQDQGNVDFIGLINTGRAPTVNQTDLLAGKNWNTGGVNYGVFARVVNLFDVKNCIQVFPTTGRCDAGAPDQRRANYGNNIGPDVVSTYFDRPEFYADRRSIYTGVRLEF